MSKIEWTEKTWNPIVGCSVVSRGCTNCYAMKMAARLEAMAGDGLDDNGYAVRGTGPLDHYRGTTRRVNGTPVWTGKVALAPEHILLEPLRRKKPTMWFVNSMSDLFHEDVPDEWIDRVFAVMALTPQHAFQVLTKRAVRMRAYMLGVTNGRTRAERWGKALDPNADVSGFGPDHNMVVEGARMWPLHNVWLGVSCEDQKRADERIPDLLATPAAVRFVSAEPLLSDIDFSVPLRRIEPNITIRLNALTGLDGAGKQHPKLAWVIVGGESGPNARPMHPDWARGIRDQCLAAGVPFFFKQWGAWGDYTHLDVATARWGEDRIFTRDGRTIGAGHPRHGGGVDPGWRDQGGAWMRNVGKKAAGRHLDGREWNDMPIGERAAEEAA